MAAMPSESKTTINLLNSFMNHSVCSVLRLLLLILALVDRILQSAFDLCGNITAFHIECLLHNFTDLVTGDGRSDKSRRHEIHILHFHADIDGKRCDADAAVRL